MSNPESCVQSLPRTALWTRACAQLTMSIGNLYCRAFHRSISRPVNGKYRCWQCLREFDMEW